MGRYIAIHRRKRPERASEAVFGGPEQWRVSGAGTAEEVEAVTAPAELLQGWAGLHHTHQFNRLVVLHQGRKSKYMQKSSSKGFHSKTSSVNNFDELLLLLSFTSLIIVHNRCMMAILRSCCLCFSTRTGSFVLGTVGIILGATLLAPMAVFLDYHSYYITQFVASERVGGNYIDDDQVNFLLQNMSFLRL